MTLTPKGEKALTAALEKKYDLLHIELALNETAVNTNSFY